MKQIIFKKTRTIRELRKWIPFSNGGGKSEPDGYEEIYFETSVDLETLNQLARKAARNKSQKAHDGPIHVRVLERNKLP